jgi:hypothetical protein
VYGGAAQDFGTGRANWETYGWSLFKLAARPGDAAPEETPSTDVKIQVGAADRLLLAWGLQQPVVMLPRDSRQVGCTPTVSLFR